MNQEYRDSTIGLTSNQQMGFRDYEEKPKKRNCCVRFCCCCCLSRTGALCCALFTIILLGGIAAAVFFLFPRIPQIDFKDVTYADGTSFNAANAQSKIQSSDGSISIPLAINVNVKSENYINIGVSNITVIGKIDGNTVGQGALPKPIVIVAHATTPILLPFNLIYNLKDNNSNNIALLKLLTDSCSSDASKRKKLKLDYDIKLFIDLIKWTGYVPSVNNSFDFDCPWDIADLAGGSGAVSLLNGLLGKGN